MDVDALSVVALDCADLAPWVRLNVETHGLATVHSDNHRAAARLDQSRLLLVAAAQRPPKASGVALVLKVSAFSDELLARLSPLDIRFVVAGARLRGKLRTGVDPAVGNCKLWSAHCRGA